MAAPITLPKEEIVVGGDPAAVDVAGAAAARAKAAANAAPPAAQGGGGDDEDADAAFLTWLRVNGANVDSVEWPVHDARVGRIARAARDVAADAAVLRVPEALLMTPSAAEASEIGEYTKQHAMRGDLLLSTFILAELRKGAASFWAPFLRMLPAKPATLCDWGAEDRARLSDDELAERASSRDRWVADLHRRYFTTLLSSRYADAFPPDFYTVERFRFAWLVVQSRAFGRKLKETALVPFADCLNHGADTKCSYRMVDGVFELYPTADGEYVAGPEKGDFNSSV